MKFIHISDLHFGKNIFGYSLIENGDQPFWIEEFFKLVDREKVDAIVIAGDVYDRSVPSKEAVNLLDEFMTRLAKLKIPVMMIAGNHDSGTRLAFGSSIFKDSNIYIAGEVKKDVVNVTLEDDYGPITFWLVPYLFPAVVMEVLQDDSIVGYQQAFSKLLEAQNIDYSKRNILVAHQLVTSYGQKLETEGSETIVGGVGNIDVDIFKDFDYVALGHIHAPQKIKYDHIRYSGSPLCYHFDEARRANKGVIIVGIDEKGKVDIKVEELPVLHNMRTLKGEYATIVNDEINNDNKNEYIRVVLTDDVVVSNARANLTNLFASKNSYLMEVVHEPKRLKQDNINIKTQQKQSLDELFIDFYRERNNDEFPNEMLQGIIDFVSQQVENSQDDDMNKPSDKDIDKIIEYVLKQEEK